MKKIILLLILAIVVNLYTIENKYIEIPSTSIRMRVIGKSNSKRDQENKILIKKELEKRLYDLTKNKTEYDDIDTLLKSNRQIIEDELKNYINNKNMGYKIKTNYGYNFFPEKEYKGIIYKAGNYKSFLVTIDEGKGNNWWCVLYPPLCLVDDTKENPEYHLLIKDILNKYN